MSCLLSCRRLRASPRPAVPSRRCRASRSRPPDDRVELRATDMEVALRVPLSAQVERDGTVVLPARLLLDVARQLPAGTVSLELRPAEQDVEVVCGPAKFHIRTLRAEDFPPLPDRGGDQVVMVPAEAFVETIARVARSASRDETRPILTGILVSASGTDLRMVATDSYRLSVKETRLEAPLESGFEANVPARALQELERIATAVSAETIAHRRPRQPGRLRDRRDRPVVPADRWSVPELPPAAAGDLRARTARRRGRVGRRGQADQPHGAEERAAAARASPRAS